MQSCGGECLMMILGRAVMWCDGRLVQWYAPSPGDSRDNYTFNLNNQTQHWHSLGPAVRIIDGVTLVLLLVLTSWNGNQSDIDLMFQCHAIRVMITPVTIQPVTCHVMSRDVTPPHSSTVTILHNVLPWNVHCAFRHCQKYALRKLSWDTMHFPGNLVTRICTGKWYIGRKFIIPDLSWSPGTGAV